MASSGPEPSLRYHNKVVIVTGGTKGIGEATVRVFVNNGASVVFCSKEEMATDLEAELKSSKRGTAIYVSCDVTREEEIKRLIDVTVKTYGKIDCLINNAGWHPPEQIIDDTSAQEFQDLLKLNLIGYFLTAKGAVTAMTKAMAVDESQYNVRINSISPGNIWTPLWEELSSHSTDPDAMILGGKDAQLLGRMGTAEECAKAALFLAAEGTFCTGIDILLTGGAELNYANKNQQKTRSSIYH
ncbi:17-beta-hydroxysteroid dehydrogenase 14 isoform X2 [Bufo bufo]|uniref:17-beta-hydroxysteroid dehydrogenase 14 isoform X2 n=1 Tax=Bufo bufo TaxID=8384 RepID=UPI001ABE5D8B|nr:17-beta-hydroxysteroid dehydrogenase 14 isoform X2 [Bufo bufo]